MIRDMQKRETLRRTDDEVKRSIIYKAREHIYKKNYAVDSEVVEDLLKEQSLVPTVVSMEHMISVAALILTYRTHFQISYRHLVLTCISCWSLTLCMSLNLESGRPYSSIF